MDGITGVIHPWDARSILRVPLEVDTVAAISRLCVVKESLLTRYLRTSHLPTLY